MQLAQLIIIKLIDNGPPPPDEQLAYMYLKATRQLVAFLFRSGLVNGRHLA